MSQNSITVIPMQKIIIAHGITTSYKSSLNLKLGNGYAGMITMTYQNKQTDNISFFFFFLLVRLGVRENQPSKTQTQAAMGK